MLRFSAAVLLEMLNNIRSLAMACDEVLINLLR